MGIFDGLKRYLMETGTFWLPTSRYGMLANSEYKLSSEQRAPDEAPDAKKYDKRYRGRIRPVKEDLVKVSNYLGSAITLGMIDSTLPTRFLNGSDIPYQYGMLGASVALSYFTLKGKNTLRNTAKMMLAVPHAVAMDYTSIVAQTKQIFSTIPREFYDWRNFTLGDTPVAWVGRWIDQQSSIIPNAPQGYDAAIIAILCYVLYEEGRYVIENRKILPKIGQIFRKIRRKPSSD